MFRFRAMNTDVEVHADEADEVAVAVRVAATFHEAEQRFSRFREDSELSRLNRAHGRVAVSRELFNALTRARRYVELTSGLFEPAIGGPLVALGYDKSFAPATLDREHAAPRPRPGRFLELVLDPARLEVERPPHLHLDLGGMIKGRTVDLAAELLPGSGAIDAGGDAALRGAPGGEPWQVEVEDPWDAARTLATLRVRGGAVATSAANRRRWRVGDREVHHLIDPRSQAPAVTDLAQVTVLAPSAELADVLAKTTYILGSRAGRRFLRDWPGVGAVLVRRHGLPLFVGDVDVREVHLA